MAVALRTIVYFTATGTVGLVGISPVLARAGDIVLDVLDTSTQQSVLGNFGSPVVSPAAGGNLQIAETSANSAIAGHVCLAILGVGPAG
jgi:hypothetical protein